MEKNELKPTCVFHYFEEICRVPRPSKKEEKIRAYLVDLRSSMAWNIRKMRLEIS